jgi:hypothetical protein
MRMRNATKTLQVREYGTGEMHASNGTFACAKACAAYFGRCPQTQSHQGFARLMKRREINRERDRACAGQAQR